jgi:small-conductance mechanosensitive channel
MTNVFPAESSVFLFALAAAYLVSVVFTAIIPFARKTRSSLLKIFHPLVLMGLCEYMKRFISPPEFHGLLNGIELLLGAWLSIHLVVNVYIGQFLVERRKLPVSSIVRDTAKLVIITAFVIIFLRFVLHWNLAAILTPSAILTAIIGLAMQDTISNFISGLLIHAEKPFDINDWIEVEDKQGQVRELNWRYTKIETIDRYYLIIPNSKIATQKVINFSKPIPTVNEYLSIGVSYDVPPLKVKRAVEAILKANASIVKDERHEVLLHEYADSSIIYRIKYAIRDFSMHRRVRDEVYSAIWYQFRKQDIQIPYPIRTVIMQKEPSPRDDSGYISVLSAIPFFNGVSPEGIANMLRFGITRNFDPSRIVVAENVEGDSMFFILGGEFSVTRNGKIVSTLGKGEFFGEMSLLTGDKRNARVEAITQGTLLEIDRNAFKVLLESEPAIMRLIENIFNRRVAANKEAGQDLKKDEEIRQTLWSRFKNIFGLA